MEIVPPSHLSRRRSLYSLTAGRPRFQDRVFSFKQRKNQQSCSGYLSAHIGDNTWERWSKNKT